MSARPWLIYRTLRPLTLASASPRRKDLLRSVGLDFDIVPSGIEETGDPAEPAEALGRRWASGKAESVSMLTPNRWIIAADTIVLLEGEIFGKPQDEGEAFGMLRRLSGKVHEVITAIALAHGESRILRVQSVRTRVKFRDLSEAEIKAYVRSGEPLDKAGAYGIQGIGAFLVHSIEGSYTNVVGLPLAETIQWLLDCGAIAPAE